MSGGDDRSAFVILVDDEKDVRLSYAQSLDLAGFALHNEGSLPHISAAGATATGTHGSGSGLGTLCTVVRALEILGSDGAVRTLNHDSVDFPGAVIHLGLLVLRVVSS